MNLDDLLGPKPNVIDLRAENRWEAIEELTEHLVQTQKLRPELKEPVLSAVKRRESAMSTGIGYGIALPHASTDLVPNLTVAIGRSRQGLPFEALDGKPVHLVVLFLVPPGQFQKHLTLLAHIGKLLHRRDFRDGLWDRLM